MSNEFWSPKYEGSRFDDNAIPLELLEDLGALQDLLIEIAKEIYYEETGKKKVPNGFADGISLKLCEVGEGSAVAKLAIAFVSLGSLTPIEKIAYYEKAKQRAIDLVETAHSNQVSIPDKYLPYFYRLGKNLNDDEHLDFASDKQVAFLDRNLRRRIAARIERRSNELIQIVGTVPNMDKGKPIFTLEKNGKRIICAYNRRIKKEIKKAYDGYDEGLRARIVGLGEFNHELTLTGFKTIDNIEVLPPVNIFNRLNSFRDLEKGWMDGEGSPFDESFLEWVEDSISSYLDFDFMVVPNIFPTIDGSVQLEWTSKNLDLSLKITHNRLGELHLADLSKNDDSNDIDKKINLLNKAGWDEIIEIVNKNFQY